MQHEITTVRPLLDSRGVLLEPGYSKGLLPQPRGGLSAAHQGVGLLLDHLR